MKKFNTLFFLLVMFGYNIVQSHNEVQTTNQQTVEKVDSENDIDGAEFDENEDESTSSLLYYVAGAIATIGALYLVQKYTLPDFFEKKTAEKETGEETEEEKQYDPVKFISYTAEPNKEMIYTCKRYKITETPASEMPKKINLVYVKMLEDKSKENNYPITLEPMSAYNCKEFRDGEVAFFDTMKDRCKLEKVETQIVYHDTYECDHITISNKTELQKCITYLQSNIALQSRSSIPREAKHNHWID